ncbi:hypothetical protein V6N11_048113 [Hibiscus sabdariffa]|uniref:Uncharacterized protein n=2 Tax=Hibiscus sabdariffa TaxID=183260 RepID=A0ABR2ERC9_9ROSI
MICKECGKNIESSLWSLVLSFRQREGLWGYTKQSAFTLSEKSVSLAEEEVNNDDDALKGVLVLQTTILSIELKDLEVGFDFVPMTDSRFRSKGSKGFASGQALVSFCWGLREKNIGDKTRLNRCHCKCN